MDYKVNGLLELWNKTLKKHFLLTYFLYTDKNSVIIKNSQLFILHFIDILKIAMKLISCLPVMFKLDWDCLSMKYV